MFLPNCEISADPAASGTVLLSARYRDSTSLFRLRLALLATEPGQPNDFCLQPSQVAALVSAKCFVNGE